jgi:hypothetical protein
MASEAQFQNLGLKVYITRDDFLVLLGKGEVYADLWYRKELALEGQVYVTVSPEALEALTEWYNGERSLIDQLKRTQRARYAQSRFTERKVKGAKKRRRVQRATDRVPEVE